MTAIITLRKDSDIYPIAFVITLLPVLYFLGLYYLLAIDKITITYHPKANDWRAKEKDKEKIEVMSNYIFFGVIILGTFVTILWIYWVGVLVGLRPNPPGFDKKK